MPMNQALLRVIFPSPRQLVRSRSILDRMKRREMQTKLMVGGTAAVLCFLLILLIWFMWFRGGSSPSPAPVAVAPVPIPVAIPMRQSAVRR